MTNQEQIIALSKKHKLSHVGSCLSVLPILEEIYAKREPGDIVILDNAHAHLAHLVVSFNSENRKKEDIFNPNWVEDMLELYGIHCDKRAGCDASGGSLGHGIGIGIGYALADPTRNVYVIVSDGSMMEGSNWEALRLTDSLGISNLNIYCNFNGYTAVDKIDPEYFLGSMGDLTTCAIEYRETTNGLKELEGIEGHYKILE